MTATDELRRLLDERGVEWLDDSYAQLWCTVWDGQDGKQWRMTENQSGMLTELKAWKVTPEQAIAATLGDVPRLPHWWTHDGTLHIELPKLPESISVRLPAQRDREVGSARVWQYMRDSGTCHDVWDTELTGRLRFQCSECGAVSLEITPNFCPVCGRRVEVDA